MNENRPVVQTRLPSVDQVLRSPTGQVAAARFGHAATVSAIRKSLASLRTVIRSNGPVIPEQRLVVPSNDLSVRAMTCHSCNDLSSRAKSRDLAFRFGITVS